MKSFTAILAAVLLPVMMFQLRANLVALTGPLSFPPDLVTLIAALAACHAPPSVAVLCGALCGACTDLTSDARFGMFALRDASLCLLFLPTRRVFDYQSAPAVFAAAFLFTAVQKLATGLLIAPTELEAWLPIAFGLSLSTAILAPLLSPCAQIAWPTAERPARRCP